jgi:hypothetical protein
MSTTFSATSPRSTEEADRREQEGITHCIKASPWVYPEHHQEFTDRPKGYLGGGYGDSQREMEHHYAMNRPAPIKIAGSNSVKREMEHHYAMNRPAPIKIAGSNSVKNSPFFHK